MQPELGAGPDSPPGLGYHNGADPLTDHALEHGGHRPSLHLQQARQPGGAPRTGRRAGRPDEADIGRHGTTVPAHSRVGPTLAVVAPPVLSYRRAFRFELTPDVLWDRIEQVDQFEAWWPWLSEFRLEGDGLTTGSVLHGLVSPPLPYRMAIRVALDRCERPRTIVATVGGDLSGPARLWLSPEDDGTRAEVTWTVEMHQPAMRWASRIGGPLLRWGHDRVVETTVAGFRRRVERPEESERP